MCAVSSSADPPTDAADALIALNASPLLPRIVLARLAKALAPPGEPASPRADPARHSATPAAGVDLPGLCERLGLEGDELGEARERIATAAAIAAAQRTAAGELGARVVTLFDPGYRPALLELETPPPVLYVRGRIPDGPAVAIVGSRAADRYARDAATLFARELAGRGLTVVSGMAIGVDGAAHRGALDAAGGVTVGVLGCGLDRDYPRSHRRLARRVVERGALVTEFPLGFAPLARNFPIRNRIIAALSIGVLVVRAALRSGSLITARYAMELGRDVYAIPGELFDPRAEGTNRLIQDGALLARTPEDVVDSLPDRIRARLPPPAGEETEPAPPSGELARRLWEALPRRGALSCEQIAQRCRLPPSEALALLLELELGGWARRHPGPTFSRPPG